MEDRVYAPITSDERRPRFAPRAGVVFFRVLRIKQYVLTDGQTTGLRNLRLRNRPQGKAADGSAAFAYDILPQFRQ